MHVRIYSYIHSWPKQILGLGVVAILQLLHLSSLYQGFCWHDGKIFVAVTILLLFLL